MELLELINREVKARYNRNSSHPIDIEMSWNDEIKRSMYDTDILSNNLLLIKCLDMVGPLALECLNADPEKTAAMGEVVVELN